MKDYLSSNKDWLSLLISILALMLAFVSLLLSFRNTMKDKSNIKFITTIKPEPFWGRSHTLNIKIVNQGRRVIHLESILIKYDDNSENVLTVFGSSGMTLKESESTIYSIESGNYSLPNEQQRKWICEINILDSLGNNYRAKKAESIIMKYKSKDAITPPYTKIDIND